MRVTAHSGEKASAFVMKLMSASLTLSTKAPGENAGGRLQNEANDRDDHIGRQAARMLRKCTPGVFYTRLAFDRLVADTVQRLADADHAEAFSRIEERARKEQGTRFWWQPGSSSPAKAPALH